MAAHRFQSPRRIVARAVLIGLAMAGALTALLVVGGFSSIAFTSGSMQPTHAEGALAITRSVPAGDVAVGDVVSVVVGDERVTHRVISVDALAGSTSLSLRGDANVDPDPEPYLVDHVDRVIVSIPQLGRAAEADVWLLVLIGVVAAKALVWSRLGRGARRRADVGPTGVRTTTSGIAMVGVLGAVVFGAAPTSAFWTDVGTGTSGSFSTQAAITSPTFVACAVDGTHVDGTWTNVGQRFNYRATLNTLTGTQVGGFSSAPYPGALNAAPNVTAHILPTDFTTLSVIAASGQRNFNIRVYAQAFGSTATTNRWISSTFATIPVRFETLGSSSYQMRCGHDTATTVAITALTNDSNITTDFVTNVPANSISGTGEPGSTISITRGGSQVATATVGAGGTWTSTGLTLTEGSQTLTATATDPFGNTAVASKAVVLDTVVPAAPTVTSTCLNPNGTTAVGNVRTGSSLNWCKLVTRPFQLTYPASDGGSGPSTGDSLQYSNDGAATTTYTSTVNMEQKDGRVMRARAKDLAGNLSPEVSNTYYIDGTAPLLAITAPGAGLSLSLAVLGPLLDSSCGGNAACGLSSDPVSGLVPASSVQWQLTRTPLIGSSTCFTATNTTDCTGYAFQNTGGTLPVWNVPRSRTGVYQITSSYVLVIRSTDQAGNVATLTRSFSTVL